MYTDKHSGIQYTQKQIDKYTSKASSLLFQLQKEEYGYNFCQKCSHNGTVDKLDPAHVKSRKWCKENSEIEYTWNLDNLQVWCRKCHQKEDKLNVQLNWIK